MIRTSSLLLTTLTTSLLFVAACSKSSTNSSSGGDAGNGGQKKTKEFKQSYQFKEAGCDTEKQTFVSADALLTEKMMCEGLKDNELNHYCAEDTRKWWFEQVCVGYTWE